jgi:hypothetical protein
MYWIQLCEIMHRNRYTKDAIWNSLITNMTLEQARALPTREWSEEWEKDDRRINQAIRRKNFTSLGHLLFGSKFNQFVRS